MKKVALVAVAVMALLMWTDGLMACQKCGCSAKAKISGCPVKAALSTVKLTPEQNKKVAGLMATCKAACTKAAGIGCSKTRAKVIGSARKKLKTDLLALLTPEQRKVVEPALAKWTGRKGSTPKACGAKKASPCGGAAK